MGSYSLYLFNVAILLTETAFLTDRVIRYKLRPSYYVLGSAATHAAWLQRVPGDDASSNDANGSVHLRNLWSLWEHLKDLMFAAP